jgi:hypothetical protein
VSSKPSHGGLAQLRAIYGGAPLAVTALAYLAGVTAAELLVTYVTDARLGLLTHCLLLAGLLIQSARTEDARARAVLVSLAFAPLIRIMSLTLPLIAFPEMYWYLLTSLPLFAAALVAGRAFAYSWRDLGLNLRGLPLQLLISLVGLGLGFFEYRILNPDPLISSLDWTSFWLPALILLISTGLLEEVIFRGLLQRSIGLSLGYWWGILYVAALFAVLHVGYKSLPDVLFVFAVGVLFGWIVERTGSLVGVTLAHGLTNIMLFLVMPFL